MQPNSSSKTWVCFFLFNANPMSQCWRTVSMFLWLACDSWCSLTNKKGTRCQIETSFNSLLCQYELIHFSTRQKTVSWSVLPHPPMFIILSPHLPTSFLYYSTCPRLSTLFIHRISCFPSPALSSILCFVFLFLFFVSAAVPQNHKNQQVWLQIETGLQLMVMSSLNLRITFSFKTTSP